MRRIALSAVLALCLAPNLAAQSSPPAAKRWYKGNTHTHTINSDGDSSPDDVAKWYKEHGYQFLVLTDHNVLTSVDALNALHGLDERFLVIRGEEVTDRFEGKPIHINSLDPEKLVPPQGGKSVLDVMQRDVDAIRAARGMPSINHPNFGWAVTKDELQQVRNNRLFEIYSGHPLVNNVGGGGVPPSLRKLASGGGGASMTPGSFTQPSMLMATSVAACRGRACQRPGPLGGAIPEAA